MQAWVHFCASSGNYESSFVLHAVGLPKRSVHSTLILKPLQGLTASILPATLVLVVVIVVIVGSRVRFPRGLISQPPLPGYPSARKPSTDRAQF